MRREAIAAVVAVLVVSLGVVYLSFLGAGTTTSAASTETSKLTTTRGFSEGPLVFVSPTSEQGLQLRVVLNSSVIPTNGTLGAQIGLYNTLDKNASLSVTEDQQISTWDGADFLCGWNPSGNLAGFALFKGDVTATNLSEAGEPLHLDPVLFPYIQIGCPTQEGFPANVTFFPKGDRISYAYGASADVNPKTVGCAYTEQESQCTGSGLVGYWNDSVSTGGDLGFSSPAFVRFAPGEYTVVATDPWGQYVYATFVVTVANASSQSSSATSSTSQTCYGGALPANTSASAGRPAYSRTVFNVTREFDSWSWTPLSTFEVGSYTFVTTNPATAQGVFQLEPQLFINATDSQGQMQRASFTNLGGWNGQAWPPDMGIQATLFGGDVTIQWLFLCDSHSVLLEVTTQ